MDIKIKCRSSVLSLIALYIDHHRAPSSENKFTVTGKFVQDYSTILETLATYKNLLMVGDFNFHVGMVGDASNRDGVTIEMLDGAIVFINMLMYPHTSEITSHLI